MKKAVALGNNIEFMFQHKNNSFYKTILKLFEIKLFTDFYIKN